MRYEDVWNAVNEARETVRKGDLIVGQTIDLAVGRLRYANVDPLVLANLKRELREFNMTTLEWKP